MEINDGEIFIVMVFLDPKSQSLCACLSVSLIPTSGKVLVDDNDVTRISPDKLVRFRLNNMSIVFQIFALMPHLTVLENISFGLDLAGVNL